jgi:TonB family protein
LVEKAHYSSLGKGRLGAALAVSLLAHALPVLVLARVYLVEPVVVNHAIDLPADASRPVLTPEVRARADAAVKEARAVQKIMQPAPPSILPPAPAAHAAFAPQPKIYFSAQQVDQLADMLVPLDPSFFSDDYTLSGSVILEVAVNSSGTVDSIDVVSAKGDDGRFQSRIIEWLKSKRFNPARKDGKTVDSLFRFELNLEKVDKPFEGVPAWPPPGHLPKLDSKGNPIPDGPLKNRANSK